MEYIRVSKDNLEKEHICCAISGNKDVQVSSKKAWLADRFEEGLVFLKSTERGKCFIEYIPAEYAWNPIHAPGYMYIDCLWVSGSLKGHGYSNDLLSECIKDSREKGKRDFVFLQRQRRGRSKAVHLLHVLLNARNIRILIREDMFFSIRTSVLSMQNMSRFSKKQLRKTGLHSFIGKTTGN